MVEEFEFLCIDCGAHVICNTDGEDYRCSVCDTKYGIKDGVLVLSSPESSWSWVPDDLMDQINELAGNKPFQYAV